MTSSRCCSITALASRTVLYSLSRTMIRPLSRTTNLTLSNSHHTWHRPRCSKSEAVRVPTVWPFGNVNDSSSSVALVRPLTLVTPAVLPLDPPDLVPVVGRVRRGLVNPRLVSTTSTQEFLVALSACAARPPTAFPCYPEQVFAAVFVSAHTCSNECDLSSAEEGFLVSLFVLRCRWLSAELLPM